MFNVTTPSIGNVYNNFPKNDEQAPVRNKRSIEQPRVEGSAIDFSGPSANDRPKSSGGLDSLGRGNLL
ncbi:hypothetical protein HKK55_01615 [Pseudomonas sp. ADAK18]|uniref:hypothetical protein n=1 Tax=Pseudomonas sp. ADAK18 TaxID=2730848 RepID=UPI00146293AE|nr:hypothetical protein [Pseudomonas sp. ADAK18]QJI27448.1 hypothetical protein HKK55_01615 [Pseudomonas sp. ADAK18]